MTNPKYACVRRAQRGNRLSTTDVHTPEYGVACLNPKKGCISRDQIEQMAEARFNSKQAHIKEFSGFEGPTWADIDPDTMELEKRDMIAAVEAAGFEVAA